MTYTAAAFQFDAFLTCAFQSEFAAGTVEDRILGGDDAFHHPHKHKGWDKKAWERQRAREDALEETILKTYQEITGVAPTQTTVAKVAKEVKEKAPITGRQIFADYSGLQEWLQAQEALVREILQSRDDEEEAILMLL